MKVLIIRLSALGDVAMTLPVVYAVARQHPDVRFTLLTRPFFARLFINRPENLDVMEADFKGRHRGLKGLTRLLSEITAKRFTHVADLHNVLRAWEIDTWMRLQGCKVAMLDKARSQRRKVLQGGKPQKPYLQRYVEVFEALGLKTSDQSLRLGPCPSRQGEASKLRSSEAASQNEASKPRGLEAPSQAPLSASNRFSPIFPKAPACPIPLRHPAVGIAPFARYANKTYPTDLMQQVVLSLASEGVSVYLFGARGAEAAQLETWKGAESIAGRLSLEDELAVMYHLDAMVAMDSANQHLASLAGTPVVTIWGSTTPACGFQPYGQPTERSLVANQPCQPCTIAGSPQCPLGTLACFRSITPQNVADQIRKTLAENQK